MWVRWGWEHSCLEKQIFNFRNSSFTIHPFIMLHSDQMYRYLYYLAVAIFFKNLYSLRSKALHYISILVLQQNMFATQSADLLLDLWGAVCAAVCIQRQGSHSNKHDVPSTADTALQSPIFNPWFSKVYLLLYIFIILVKYYCYVTSLFLLYFSTAVTFSTFSTCLFTCLLDHHIQYSAAKSPWLNNK